MTVWEIDCYRRPLRDEAGNSLWELVVCDSNGPICEAIAIPQPDLSSEWILQQLRQLLTQGASPPSEIRVFRPQTLNLLEAIAPALGIPITPTRRTPHLKQYLQDLAQHYPNQANYTKEPYHPFELDQPPPLPLDETLWGNKWQFAALKASDLVEAFTGRMIPILEMPSELLPLQLGLPSTLRIPGVVIEAGRQSLRLATWLQNAHPVALQYIPGMPDGLVMAAGLVDRWVIATFEDPDVIQAATEFEHRKIASQGLHFLLVQPDDSGMTYSGFWLLKAE